MSLALVRVRVRVRVTVSVRVRVRSGSRVGNEAGIGLILLLGSADWLLAACRGTHISMFMISNSSSRFSVFNYYFHFSRNILFNLSFPTFQFSRTRFPVSFSKFIIPPYCS